MAGHLNHLNQERRVIESGMQQQALQAVEKIRLPGEASLPLGLCLFEPTWHQGVIGIVAGRMKERLHRPVIAFAPENAEGEMLKGSARSVPDCMSGMYWQTWQRVILILYKIWWTRDWLPD